VTGVQTCALPILDNELKFLLELNDIDYFEVEPNIGDIIEVLYQEL